MRIVRLTRARERAARERGREPELQRRVAAACLRDLVELGVQVVVELVQRGDLFQRRQAVIVDDAVDLVDRIRHKLRQLFVLDGLPQVFQRTGSVDVLDKVFVLLDDILQLLQLFLIGAVLTL